MTVHADYRLGAYVDDLTEAILVGIRELEATQGKEAVILHKEQLVSLKQTYDGAAEAGAYETLLNALVDLKTLLNELEQLCSSFALPGPKAARWREAKLPVIALQVKL